MTGEWLHGRFQMGRRGRRDTRAAVSCAAALIAIALLAGCGNEKGSSPIDPLLDKANLAKDAQAKTQVRVGMAAAQMIYVDAGGYGSSTQEMATLLNSRDESATYTTGPSSGPSQVQVVGGGSQPIMLVARSTSGNYAAAWESGEGNTRYYLGTNAPEYTTQAPSAEGWSESP